MRKKKMTVNKGFLGMGFILALGLFVLSSSSLWGSVEVSFRLSGSPLGYLQDGAGDIDRVRRGIEANLADLVQDPCYSTSFNWERRSRTNDFRAELIFKISRNFGVSVGSGYIFAKNQGFYTMGYNYEEYYELYEPWYWGSNENSDYTRKYTISAIPINLDAYFFLPIGKKQIFNIFAHVGAGCYFGKLEHILGFDSTYSYVSSRNGLKTHSSEGVVNGTLTEKANSRTLGFNGGLGLDVRAARFISFEAEVYGRHVEFHDWEGSQVIKGTQKGKSWWQYWGEETIDNSITESAFGNLWTYESRCSQEDKGYTMMWILDEEPKSSYRIDARKSSISLSSYGLTVSFKLSFNLF